MKPPRVSVGPVKNTWPRRGPYKNTLLKEPTHFTSDFVKALKMFSSNQNVLLVSLFSCQFPRLEGLTVFVFVFTLCSVRRCKRNELTVVFTSPPCLF